jgi:hypothetical protein
MELKTTNIKGKEYVQVNERVRAFRTHPDFANMSLETSIIDISEKHVLMVAKVLDSEGLVRSTGHAEEVQTNSGVNSTSFIENCETSAVGRCLGFLGIGVDSSIATSEEVGQAIARQEAKSDTKPITEKKVEKVKANITNKGSETLLDWKEVVCPVGKHKGKLMGEIFKNDPSYLGWMAKNMEAKTPDFKMALDASAKELNGNGKQGFKKAG